MRFDAVGMFWEDAQVQRGKRNLVRMMPPIPDTGWVPPSYFPDLSRARVLSVDCETFDPELEDHGPGWARGKGHIVGVAIGADGGGRWYFPIRHTIEPEHNLNPEQVLDWLRIVLANPNQPKVGANLLYDYGWLRSEGVNVAGELVDVQYAEALLVERGEVNLEHLGRKWLGEGKDTTVLYKWLADFYGGKPNSDQRKNIYRCPPRLVGPYAESDADLPLRIIPHQYAHLEREGLVDLFRLECSLIRLLVRMREAGVRVHLGRAEELRERLIKLEEREYEKLKHIVGFDVDIGSGPSLARAFDHLGIRYGRTAKGKPSFTKKFLTDLQHPVGHVIRDMRKYEKLRGTFVESYILNSHINQMVYGQFHLLRGDDSGTRSGRLSSSTPNLQNIPIRDEELAHLIRGLFIPDEGHEQWRKYDYSQIEYRYLIHFAVGPGSDEARALFNQDPDTDYHEMALDLVGPAAGWDISTPEQRKVKRRPIKDINFGLIFGMGEDAMASRLNLSPHETSRLFKAYHKAVPFAKATMKQCSDEVLNTGVITTILNRRSRFDLWEPSVWGSDAPALTYEKAILQYGQIRRAFAHKGLNRRLQGSAADQMKMAMARCYYDGIFDVTGVPRLTVHDELDFSDPGGKDEAFREMKHVMETCIPLRIPVRADCEVGPDWGHVKEI